MADILNLKVRNMANIFDLKMRIAEKVLGYDLRDFEPITVGIMRDTVLFRYKPTLSSIGNGVPDFPVTFAIHQSGDVFEDVTEMFHFRYQTLLKADISKPAAWLVFSLFR